MKGVCVRLQEGLTKEKDTTKEMIYCRALGYVFWVEGVASD